MVETSDELVPTVPTVEELQAIEELEAIEGLPSNAEVKSQA